MCRSLILTYIDTFTEYVFLCKVVTLYCLVRLWLADCQISHPVFREYRISDMDI